jgi:hypothetical protein
MAVVFALQRLSGNAVFGARDPAASGASGSLGATDGADAVVVAGVEEFYGAGTGTDGFDLAQLNGGTGVIGAIAATEGADAVAINGQMVAAAAGSIDAIEGADAADFSGLFTQDSAGALDAVDGADEAAMDGLHSVPVDGDVFLVDGADVIQFDGSVVSSIYGIWARVGTATTIWTNL